MSNFTEIWLPVKNYEGLYEVSNLGRVKSLPIKKRKGGRILKSRNNGWGYSIVNLYRNGKYKTKTVHRLVAEAFFKNPENKRTINHKDGVKSNNFWWNLEWATYSENHLHAYKIGLSSKDHCKKKVVQIKNGKVLKIWESQSDASNHSRIGINSISKCCRGMYKSAGGFQWKFADPIH